MVPDHGNKMSITVEQVIIFLLVGVLAFQFVKTISVKRNKMKYNEATYACIVLRDREKSRDQGRNRSER